MKTTFKTLFVGIIIAGMSSCFSEDNPAELYSSTKSITDLEGVVNITEYNPDLLTGSEGEEVKAFMRGTGNSNASNLWVFSFLNSHILSYDRLNDQFFLDNGEFKISGNGTNSIYGTYKGRGTNTDNILNAELIFDIKGGEGRYHNATGSFTGKFKNNIQYPAALIMEFKGGISHDQF